MYQHHFRETSFLCYTKRSAGGLIQRFSPGQRQVVASY